MISRWSICISILIVKSSLLFSQNNNDKYKTYYDVDSIPVFTIEDLNINYYIQAKPSIKIEFSGGYKSLSHMCDSLYFNRKDYNYDEINGRALYSILFDENLLIKDVRIIKRFAYDNRKYNYDDLIKEILFSTEGKWLKTENNCEWYFYLGYFNVR